MSVNAFEKNLLFLGGTERNVHSHYFVHDMMSGTYSYKYLINEKFTAMVTILYTN